MAAHGQPALHPRRQNQGDGSPYWGGQRIGGDGRPDQKVHRARGLPRPLRHPLPLAQPHPRNKIQEGIPPGLASRMGKMAPQEHSQRPSREAASVLRAGVLAGIRDGREDRSDAVPRLPSQSLPHLERNLLGGGEDTQELQQRAQPFAGIQLHGCRREQELHRLLLSAAGLLSRAERVLRRKRHPPGNEHDPGTQRTGPFPLLAEKIQEKDFRGQADL